MIFSLKRIAVIVAVFAIFVRPLVKTLLWLHKGPLDEDVGAITILSTNQLSTFVKGSKFA